MCECLQKIATEESKKNNQNGLDACVHVSVRGEVTIKKFVVNKDRRGTKTIRRANHNRYKGIEFNYCPICGKAVEGYTDGRVWHDADGAPA